MRTIINGKVYDTSTAVGLAHWSNGKSYRDPWSKEETLFCKRTGEFFLWGEGGPESSYGERTATGWKGGSKVFPLTREEAREWGKEHLSQEDYDLIFNAPESNEKKTVSYSLSLSAIAKLKNKASSAGISASELLEKLIGSMGDEEE